MGRRYDTVSFLTDYGLDDEFVGVVKSVHPRPRPARHGRSTSPTASVPSTCAADRWPSPGRSRTSPRASCWPSSIPASARPAGRSPIEVAGGAGVLVGPDNGLLAPAVAIVGGAERAVELTNADYHLAAPGATFAGRDVFAPVAAHLCNGVDLAELGPLVDADLLMPGMVAAATRGGRRHPRRGAVGRPLRQLPAQRRPRRPRRRPSTCGRVDDRRRAPRRPRWPTSFAELGAGVGRPRARLPRDVRAGARPATRRPRPSSASPPATPSSIAPDRRRRPDGAGGDHAGRPARRSCAAPVACARCARPRPRHRAAAGCAILRRRRDRPDAHLTLRSRAAR